MATRETRTSSPILEAALDYMRRGWSVLPLEKRGKRPLVRWEEFQHRRADETEVRAWYRSFPGANVGIVTGAVSGLVVMDVDPAHGGGESLLELEKAHGALPHTIEALTGGGGRHVYFRHPGGVVRNRAGLAPGIDLRGDGGYVVAPPSVHPSGRRYRFEVAHHPDETALAPVPGWLLRLFGPAERVGHPLAHWRSLVREGVPEGARNSTLASLAGHMLWHGLDPQVVLDLLLCWNKARCRPPLPEDEVASVVESITRLHLREEAAAAPAEKPPADRD
jgi:hypothetical protein